MPYPVIGGFLGATALLIALGGRIRETDLHAHGLRHRLDEVASLARLRENVDAVAASLATNASTKALIWLVNCAEITRSVGSSGRECLSVTAVIPRLHSPPFLTGIYALSGFPRASESGLDSASGVELR